MLLRKCLSSTGRRTQTTFKAQTAHRYSAAHVAWRPPRDSKGQDLYGPATVPRGQLPSRLRVASQVKGGRRRRPGRGTSEPGNRAARAPSRRFTVRGVGNLGGWRPKWPEAVGTSVPEEATPKATQDGSETLHTGPPHLSASAAARPRRCPRRRTGRTRRAAPPASARRQLLQLSPPLPRRAGSPAPIATRLWSGRK